jgi:hypothetical protein
MAKIVLPGQNVAIQTPHNQIEPLWYEKLKGWESWINLVSAIFPSGPATPTTPATLLHASLGADVTMNAGVLTTYFNGPSIAQGTSGTWWVSGTVTLNDTTVLTRFNVKLWDGTAVIASAQQVMPALNNPIAIALSGFIASPAGNLRIDCASGGTTSKILFNASGNSKDSTISAFRIA